MNAEKIVLAGTGKDGDSCIFWKVNGASKELLKDFQRNQKINVIPGGDKTDKETLFEVGMKMQNDWGMKKYLIIPQMFLNFEDFKRSCNMGDQVLWLAKYRDDQKPYKIAKANQVTSENLIQVSKYVLNPMLTRENCKFHINLFVVITGFCPLQLHLFKEGLSYSSPKSYENPMGGAESVDYYGQITSSNFSKRLGNNYPKVECSGPKLFTQVLKELHDIGVNINKVCKNIEESIAITMIGIVACNNPEDFVKFQPKIYSLMSVDLILDSDGNALVTKIKSMEIFASESDEERNIKRHLLKDMISLIGNTGVGMFSKIIPGKCQEGIIEKCQRIPRISNIMKKDFPKYEDDEQSQEQDMSEIGDKYEHGLPGVLEDSEKIELLVATIVAEEAKVQKEAGAKMVAMGLRQGSQRSKKNIF